MDLNTLRKLSIKFEKQAQQLATSAQPGDIQTVLERANLWNTSKTVAPLLDAAGVPDASAAHIAILVSPGPKVSFNAVLDPANPNASKKLNALLAQKFAMPIANAIKVAKMSPESTLVINWLKF
jgi:hypothetical protein